MRGWTKQTITIDLSPTTRAEGTSDKVEALVHPAVPGLAVHKTPSGWSWTVTHIPSGKGVGLDGVRTRSAAYTAAVQLAALFNWNRPEPKIIQLARERAAQRTAIVRAARAA